MRRRGYQWATAGVPQSQPSTCYYRNWQSGPWPGTNSLFPEWSRGCGLCPLTDLVIFMSAFLSVWAKVVSLFLLPLSFMSFQKFHHIVLLAQCRVLSFLIFPLNQTGSASSCPFQCVSLPVYNSPQLCSCMTTRISFLSCFSVHFFLYVRVHPSLQLCETSCVCLLYLVYLLQEGRLSAAALSLYIHHIQTSIIARRTTCLPHELWLLDLQLGHFLLKVVRMCLRASSLHIQPFVPSLSALSDQLCVLTLPVFISWSTCSRRAGCQQQSSHSASVLSELKNSEKLRQALAASLLEVCFLQPHFIRVNWNIELFTKYKFCAPSNPTFFFYTGDTTHNLDCGLETQYTVITSNYVY